MTTNYYIYYKSSVDNGPQVIASFAQLKQLLTTSASMQIANTMQLQRRPQVVDGCITWMEIYLDTPTDFASILSAAVDQCDLARHIIGERHSEVFVDAQ